jgi:hypothetical protein
VGCTRRRASQTTSCVKSEITRRADRWLLLLPRLRILRQQTPPCQSRTLCGFTSLEIGSIKSGSTSKRRSQTNPRSFRRTWTLFWASKKESFLQNARRCWTRYPNGARSLTTSRLWPSSAVSRQSRSSRAAPSEACCCKPHHLCALSHQDSTRGNLFNGEERQRGHELARAREEFLLMLMRLKTSWTSWKGVFEFA